MGLSDDQRAMLRLVAQRGEQGYEDIAALKGLSVEEVRAQVAAALAQLDEEGALAGEAPAAKAESPPEPPKAAESPPASSPPAATEPKPAANKAKPRQSGFSMPTGPALRAAIAGVLIVIALVVIIVLVSGGGGGDDSTAGTSSSGDQTNAASNQPVTNSKQVTKAILSEVGGSGASGVAIFGRFKNKLALELAAEGLQFTPKGTSYTVWLAASPQKMLPLASTAVPKSGKIGAQFEVPVEVLAYLANETFSDITITRTDDATLEAALKEATEAKESPKYTGEAVLNGTVTGPVVGAAIRQEEKEKEEEG